jgi:hypothetical protein
VVKRLYSNTFESSAMTMKITQDVIESYLHCRYKSYLKLAGEQGSPHSSWVATRRGLNKPVSSSPPFKTGLAAFTAPGLTPLINLKVLIL